MSTTSHPGRHPARLTRPAQPAPAVPTYPAAGLRFFLTENLLEARRGSWLPTNGAGPDEDVNIYLALRLGERAQGVRDPRVVPGLAPLWQGPDPRLPRGERAAWYRANADHRLLTLGLFDRGETTRRRAVPWGHTVAGARARDLAVAAACYQAAACLLARGPGVRSATVAVLEKLAEHCGDYRYILGVLAVRRLGLGAHLAEAELERLLPPQAVADAGAVEALLDSVQESPPGDAVDVVLDLALEYGLRREPGLRARIEKLAPLAGLDAARLLRLAVDQAEG